MRPSFDWEELGAAMGSSACEIVGLNIQHFLALLKTELDPVKWETIKRLLADQQRMLDAWATKGCS